MLSAPYITRDECKSKVPKRTSQTLTPERYCVGPLNGMSDSVLLGALVLNLTFTNNSAFSMPTVRLKQGAGFMVRVGEIWYIRGVRGFKIEKRPEYSVITDLTEPSVRFWLSQTVPAA